MGKLEGVFAALPTVFDNDGRPDPEALDPIVEFLIDSGVDGLCVGGATGEYPACSVQEREAMFRRVAEHAKNRVSLIFGIGAGTAAQVGHLANVALECGGIAALLPPPFYFRYDPRDTVAFLRNLAGNSPLPVLIYYIPQFTNPFDLRDALQLIETAPNFAGIKDSSGMRGNIPLIANAKAKMSMTYFSGDDSLLIDALRHGADGAISGVASACPELLVEIEKVRRGGAKHFPDWTQKLLNEFISHIDPFPAPWGIKLAMEARGFQLGPLSWKGSRTMESSISAFREWFEAWLPGCLDAC